VTIRFDKEFQKQYDRLSLKLQNKTDTRLGLFLENPNNPILRLQQLRGKYSGYFSINITGDIRALYYEEEGDFVVFAMVGTHSQLYG